jgi:hypothetical protein
MPRLASSDIVHVAATDHRIPRRPGPTDRSPGEIGAARPGGPAPVLFHRDLMDDRQRAEARRDLGVALCGAGPGAAAAGLPLLDAALKARPDDRLAWQAKGVVLGQLGRFAGGLEAFRQILAREPDDEAALVGAAEFAARLGRRRDSLADWRRAIAINPGAPDTATAWPSSASWSTTGRARSRLPGTPSASTPPTPRPASSSSGPSSTGETARRRATSSGPYSPSIPRAAMS